MARQVFRPYHSKPSSAFSRRAGFGATSIVGVQRMVLRRAGKVWIFWKATWSPEPYVVARKVFSVRKYGTKKAKLLAIPPSPRGFAEYAMNAKPERNRAELDALKHLQAGPAAACWLGF